LYFENIFAIIKKLTETLSDIKKWDCIIVGLGAAGALLARYISNNKKPAFWFLKLVRQKR
jgi:ribulose 1,5-bisphosphate synthetase/thiazole synthase